MSSLVRDEFGLALVNLFGNHCCMEAAMNPDLDRQAIIDASVARYRKMLDRQLPDDNATLEQIEDAIEEIGKGVLPDLQEKLVNKRGKKSRDNKIACPCGGKARYRSMGT